MTPADLTPEQRASLQRRAFVQEPPTIGGIVMRPATAASLALCREVGVTFWDDFSQLAAAGEAEAQRQVFTFLYIHGYRDPAHAGDEKKNRAAMRRHVFLPREQFVREHLIEFAEDIEIQQVLPAVFRWWRDVQAMMQAAMFDVAPKPPTPGESPPPAPPPNS